MHPVFNLKHLHLYKQSSDHFEERTQLPTTRNLIASEEYEVEAILGHKLTSKKNGNHRRYLVWWQGYKSTEDSWISEYNLCNTPAPKGNITVCITLISRNIDYVSK
jgi:hypothetical protein